MKYSFVLPAYKARFLRESIESILRQTYTEFELIIINDASPERIYDIVSEYSDNRIKYYENTENIGGKDLVAQWNHCLSYAIGEYIILASDDDVYHITYLEQMNSLVNKYPAVNVFRPRKLYINEYGKITRIESVLKEYVSRIEFIYSWVNNWIGGGIPHYLFKKASLFQMGGFSNYPLAWFSDDSTVIRLAENGIVTSPDILFSFRMSGINICSSIHTEKTLLDKLYATNIFHKEITELINNITVVDPISIYMKEQLLGGSIDSFLFYNKILPNIFNAPFKVLISVLPIVSKFSFVNKRSLYKRVIFHCLQRVKNRLLS